ncbi:hypothetical protein ABT095_31695 [Kitasatospora sp. NPDC002227]|uniref:hypothetical protein n=1 Tax=Kitasatospora sp. NPDC002227 TaxID=3154773 RepID=UPI003330A0B0
MSGQDWTSPRLSEDMELSVAPGGPVRYARTTDKAVEYVAVANEESGVLGYLWACDADDAAGWQDRPAAGRDASNAGGFWIPKLREFKARGVSPSQMLAELAQGAGGGRIGQVVPGSRALASGLAALKEIAGDDKPKQPPASPVTRGR